MIYMNDMLYEKINLKNEFYQTLKSINLANSIEKLSKRFYIYS